MSKLAIKQFGSIKKFIKTIKYNLEHFLEIMEQYQINNHDLLQKSNILYSKLTANMQKKLVQQKFNLLFTKLSCLRKKPIPILFLL